MQMENILDKLKQIDGYKTTWSKWSLEEKKKLLDIYLIICKKESHIFDLIYDYHDCDSLEDIFRDYNEIYLEEKTQGVKMAINEIKKLIENGGEIESENDYVCNFDCESEEECEK